MRSMKSNLSKFILALLIALSPVAAYCIFISDGQAVVITADDQAMVGLIKLGRLPELRQFLKKHPYKKVPSAKRSIWMMTAIEAQQVDALDALLEWGSDINQGVTIQSEGENLFITPLAHAISTKTGLAMIRYLVLRGANVNPSDSPLLPLNFALSLHQYDVANFLLDKSANPNGQDPIGKMTPMINLAVAATQDTDMTAASDLANRLVKAKADVNAQATRGASAISFAVSAGKLDFVRTLLELEANPNTKNDKGESMLALATRKRYEDIATLLRQYGAKP